MPPSNQGTTPWQKSFHPACIRERVRCGWLGRGRDRCTWMRAWQRSCLLGTKKKEDGRSSLHRAQTTAW